MPTTLATWNVNSLKVRLPHLLDWLGAHRPTIVCLQETKLTDDKFPVADLEAAGYRSVYAGQKTYNGVAVLLHADSVTAPTEVQINLPNFADEQKRLLADTVGDLRVVCGYFPNGQAVGSEKYEYKLRWLAALTDWLRGELARYPKLALAGDYNIAPEPRDVHDPAAWEGQVLFSEPERAAFRGLLDLGLKDSFRLVEQPERSSTWWDYRNLAFRRKMCLRIDPILVT
ncbi:MAG: exodeoxyribonuclease III, partial [Betaproteobacteria bacterium]